MYELLDEIKNAPNDDVRKYILQHNARQITLDVLQGAFHPAIQFVFKEPVEYKSQDVPPGMGYQNVETEFRRVYLFTEGSTRCDPNLTFENKRAIMIQILESMEAREAEVFRNMMHTDLKVPGLTYKLVQEAYPGILP